MAGLYHGVPLDRDRVEVCNAGRTVVLTATGRAASVVGLLGALDGTASIDELTARFPELAVPSLLDSLQARGLLLDARGGGRASLTAAALHSGATPRETQRNLRSFTVMFAGCGPVAATSAVELAKAGVAGIVLADEDVVTEQEVATTPVLSREAVGRPRTNAIKDACTQLADVAVTIRSSAVPIGDVNFVIIQARYEPSGLLAVTADAALRAGVEHLVHWQDALEMVIGPVITRGGRPCHRCMESRRLSHVLHLDAHLAYLGHRAQVAPEPDSFLAAHTSIASGLLSTTVLQHLTRTTAEEHRGTAVVLDLATVQWRREDVLEVPGCVTCAAAATDPAPVAPVVTSS